MGEAIFRFEPIGQGGFYTGRIFLYHYSRSPLRCPKQFNLVFDCGSQHSDALNSRIQDFKKTFYGNKEIDLLILSHLDDDHINGIPKLLQGVQCDTILLPYLNPIERLSRYIAGPTVDPINNFSNFIKNPTNFLLSNADVNIRNIVYVKGNSEGETPKGEYNNESDGLDNQLEPLGDEEILEISSIDNLSNQEIVKFYKGNGKLFFNKYWEFYLYNEPANEEKFDEFKEFIKSQFGIDAGTSFTQDNLIEIIDNRVKIKELRDKFREIFKSTNKTGLTLLHKPINYHHADIIKEGVALSPSQRSFNHNNTVSYNRRVMNNILWGNSYLTGDICLNQIHNSSYIRSHLQQTQVFQVPHHGSATGWNVSFLNQLNVNGITSAAINFGYGNKYGHPKPKVLNDLLVKSFNFQFCNQYEYLEYYFHFEPIINAE